MMVAIGNFLFRYRNILGPSVFLLALVFGQPRYPLGRPDLNVVFDLAGVVIAYTGLGLRILTIGYEYIERGGKHRQVSASKLVQGGVFAHCRNPLYVGNLLIALGLALVVHSALFYLFVLPFIAFTYVAIVAAEEAFLLQKFGDEYRVYCKRVHRWWPNWTGWENSTRGMRFNWKRVVVKEYNTVFLLILAFALMKLWSEYQIAGLDALPSVRKMIIGTGVWLGLYFFVRDLKKSGELKA